MKKEFVTCYYRACSRLMKETKTREYQVKIKTEKEQIKEDILVSKRE